MSIVEIPPGSGNRYKYVYDAETKATVYKGPVGNAPALDEEEFLEMMGIDDDVVVGVGDFVEWVDDWRDFDPPRPKVLEGVGGFKDAAGRVVNQLEEIEDDIEETQTDQEKIENVVDAIIVIDNEQNKAFSIIEFEIESVSDNAAENRTHVTDLKRKVLQLKKEDNAIDNRLEEIEDRLADLEEEDFEAEE